MIKITEQTLNRETKAIVIDIALDLQKKLENASAGELTASDIKRQTLELQRKALSIKDNATKREEEFKLELAKIEADKIKDIKSLELKYASTEGIDAKELIQLFVNLEEQADKTKDNLSFDFEEAELVHKAKLKELEDKFNVLVEEHTATLLKYDDEVNTAQEKSQKLIKDVTTTHERKLEKLNYDNSLAIRDAMLTTATKIADEHNLLLVDKEEYNSLKEYTITDANKVKELIETAVTKAKSEVYRTEGSKFSALKNNSDMEIALLKGSKESLELRISEYITRIVNLEKQVANIPIQIKEAVAAAKTEVNTNIETSKK